MTSTVSELEVKVMSGGLRRNGTTERPAGSITAVALAVVVGLYLSAVALGAVHATAKGGVVKACGYMTSSAGGSTTEYIRIADSAAPGIRGTFLFSATGARERKDLTLNNKGIAITSFPVLNAGSETISVTLATSPATKGTFHFALRPVASDIASRIGCTPR
jgi:hypothetical protein